MIKIITNLLFVFLLPIKGNAQEINTINNEIFTNVVKENTKNIHYNITILENEKILYSNKFVLKNSQLIPLFYFEENTGKEKLEQQGKASTQSFSINEINVTQIQEKEIFQSKLLVHIEKQTNTMWSILYLQNLESIKNENINNLSIENNSQEIKGLILNKSPSNDDLKKQLIIMHQSGQETKIVWKNYLFFIKANIK